MRRIAASVLASALLLQSIPASAYAPPNFDVALVLDRLYERLQDEDTMTPDDTENQMTEEDEHMTRESTMDAWWDTMPATAKVTRAQFVQAIVEQMHRPAVFPACYDKLTSDDDFTLLFTDVTTSHPAARAICIGMVTGLVQGYRDGSFRPNEPINLAEASKILSRVFGYVAYVDESKAKPWFRPYLTTLTDRGIVPAGMNGFATSITWQQLQEMLRRLKSSISWEPSSSYEQLRRRTPFFSVSNVTNVA